MRRNRTFYGIVILLLLLGIAGWVWHLYEKPRQSPASETAAVTISADSLYRQYQADEHAGDKQFLGKVISVTGRLTEIQHSGNTVIWILSTQPGGGGINCQLFPGTVIDPTPKAGDQVTLKGRCTGYLMDVNLADCVPDKK